MAQMNFEVPQDGSWIQIPAGVKLIQNISIYEIRFAINGTQPSDDIYGFRIEPFHGSIIMETGDIGWLKIPEKLENNNKIIIQMA